MNENGGTRDENGSLHDHELQEYRQVYIDETEEELECLVHALLKLEADAGDIDALNEAFRLLHTMKGTSGLMGYLGISELTHQLESRFERLRSREMTLSRDLMNLVLKATDFLRAFNNELRSGKNPSDDPAPLIEELQQLTENATVEQVSPALASANLTLGGTVQVRVKFVPGLQLADLKARLILSRLTNIGEVIGSEPAVDEMSSLDDLPQLTIILASDRSAEEIRRVARVDGVASVEILGTIPSPAVTVAPAAPVAPPSAPVESRAPVAAPQLVVKKEEPRAVADAVDPVNEGQEVAEAASEFAAPARSVTETVRVEVQRLDRLMNLTGELLVTNAHFSQITSDLQTVFKRGGIHSRLKDLGERLRNRLAAESSASDKLPAQELLAEFAEDLQLLESQNALWEESRRRFGKIVETVDQLSRLSQNLQKRVLATRMVPVGPLFNRFRRVVRDLATERDKQVQLVIRGERTELDKRMIDELGDPLLHLIRNSIDHGLETSAERRRLGKPEVGTIMLEASQRGNSVFILVRDDGAGLNLGRIRDRALERGLVSEMELGLYSDSQIFDFIWRPGFSTANRVTEISGRGVGMDIVKNRINDLSGSISVDSQEGQGTTFTIRLPLTLAIIRSLLVQFRDIDFSIPLDDVREIVFVPHSQIRTISHRQVIDIRGQLVPLARMETIFSWNQPATGQRQADRASRPSEGAPSARSAGVNVVILQSSGRILGLCVDQLHGGANIVIKSLADNFQQISGISGASVNGDGSVCLMLDTSALFELAGRSGADAAPAPTMQTG